MDRLIPQFSFFSSCLSIDDNFFFFLDSRETFTRVIASGHLSKQRPTVCRDEVERFAWVNYTLNLSQLFLVTSLYR